MKISPRRSGRAMLRSLMAAVVVGAGLTAFAPLANAAGGEQGILLLKGPGSLYAGPNTAASLSVAAGSTASFGFEVRNTGPTTAQFNIQVVPNGTSCSSPCPPTVAVTAGSLAVTQLAAGPNGYFTAPIAPGAVGTYALKITPNKTGTAKGDIIAYQLQLADTAGAPLGIASAAYVNITRSTGTGGADQFVSASGSPATSGNDNSQFGMTTAPSVAVNKTFSFTVKLMNDAVTPKQITYQLQSQRNCDSFFPIHITQASTLGKVDVTTAVETGTYAVDLAHAASVTLTVTGTSLSGGEQCLQAAGSGSAVWYGLAQDTFESTQAYLIFSPAAS